MELDDDIWELYAPDDWTQAHDLSAEQPEKLHELQRLFLIEATRCNVLPLDDRRAERFNPDLAGRPKVVQGNRQLLFGGMRRLSENSVVVLKNRSYAVTAEIVVPAGGAEGVIVAQGGAFGGWSIYANEGRPAYCYNLFGLQRFKVYGEEPLAEGEHQVRVEFAYDGGGLGKGGSASLFVDGQPVGEGRIEGTVPMASRPTRRWTSGQTAARRSATTCRRRSSRSTARCAGSSSTSARTPRTRITGSGLDERLRIAMARQ